VDLDADIEVPAHRLAHGLDYRHVIPNQLAVRHFAPAGRKRGHFERCV